MKLFGKYHEYSINEINLYRTPLGTIERIMKNHPDSVHMTVKEYTPRKITKEHPNNPGYKDVHYPDMSKRHQVILLSDLEFVKTKLYSEPINHKKLKNLGLKPIPAVKKKEMKELALIKLGATKRGHRVEHIIPESMKISKKK